MSNVRPAAAGGDLKSYSPFWLMALATVGVYVQMVLTDGMVTNDEIVQGGVVTLGAIATYVVPRFPDLTWLKPAVAFGTAGLVALLAALSDGVTSAEWVGIVIAALGGIGVIVTNGQTPLSRRGPAV